MLFSPLRSVHPVTREPLLADHSFGAGGGLPLIQRQT